MPGVRVLLMLADCEGISRGLAEGLQFKETGFLTNTGPGGPARQLADLELRHRRHARVEDRIRAAKDTGMRNLPFHDMNQNRIWLAITALASELLVRTARAPRRLRALRTETAPAAHPRRRGTARVHRPPNHPQDRP